MSYEGYTQYICKNGHQYSCDAYDDDRNCDTCDAPAVWSYGVDQTNGCECEYIKKHNISSGRPDGLCNSHRINLEVLAPAEHETCDHCNHTKLVKHATYKIPEDIGRKLDGSQV